MPRERIDPLGAHRIALVRHRRRADLLFFERLFDLAQMLQEAQVVTELRRRLCEARQHADDLRVDFARIRLSRYREAAREPDFLGDELLEPVDLRFIALEETEKRRLRSRRAFDAEEG